MDPILTNNPNLAAKHIEDAARQVEAVEEKLQEESKENKQAYERFYNNLALFSSGTIALSVTYLGYLKAGPKPVSDQRLLILCWVLLLLCLISSLFHTLFYTHYMHYARSREVSEKRSKQRETEANELGNLHIANVTSASDRHEYEQRLRAAAGAYRKDSIWAMRRENRYKFLWIWNSRVARCAFVLGLALLFVFAVRNM